ncbi:cellulose biosynthesis cyclic di-GMP-binding regulatory protein BcsB [Rhodoferax lacus]|uniref:cellulose biosynthesis cyclic di-GMP-binding regulatory protein BcsB n=1 Tax=Rhodoferax lacus TaxID=2184758 RepID=UPI001EF1825E|nr:cellulose biosynthesis cyclic di-GMP-binding regulatory protein BcsB [Rhodoferax lacus]
MTPLGKPRPVALSAAPSAIPAAALSTKAALNQLPLRQQRISLKAMGISRPLSLRGIEGSASAGMGVRLDEVVESARLHLIFTLSPALLPGVSHLKVYFNDEVLQTVAVEKDKLGAQQSADLAIDPRYFADFNRLRFQLIGHYTLECEAPNHTSLWASISNDSYLDLGLRQLPLKSDLALLPAPFFDPRDNRQLQLQFVYGAHPSTGLLKAAGSVATWMGMLSSYRGTRFQVVENSLPDRHAIVLASNQNRPAFLKDLPPVSKPTLTMLAHPTLPGAKLLLVLGQDDAQVQQAAEVLASGRAALSGDSMAVNLLEPTAPREAYDAPRWISTKRPVQLGELVPNAADLQIRGTVLNDVIRVNTQMAPDLFTWNAGGVPMNLQYRYTPTVLSNQGTLDLSINDQFIKSYALASSEDANTVASNILLPLFDDSSVQAKTDYKIPAFLIGGDNQLQFAFQIPPTDLGRCRTVQPPEMRAAVDPQSTIDLTGFYHYLAMPSMAAYGNSGFPFTKYADLAQTSVILPNDTTVADVELYLTALGRLGASTGLAGTRFKLLKAADWEQARGTDLLVVAHADSDGLLARWGHNLPALIDKGTRSIRPLDRALGNVMDFFSIDNERRLASAGGKAILEGKGPLAAIAGLQSPLDADRTVVVLTATDTASLQTIANALTDPAKVQSMRGDLSLLRADAVESFRINPVYYVGDLPWWRKLWFALHSHPTLLALVGIATGLLLSFIVFVGLRSMARRRLNPQA